jgi:hypothetical protein
LRRLIVIVLASLAALSGVAFAALRPAGTAPDFTVSVSPPKQSVVRGAAARFSISLVRAASFTGTTALRVTGLPHGVHASWELDDGKRSRVVPSAQTGAILRLRTTTRTPLGRLSVDLVAVGGEVTRSRSLTLIVEEKGLPGFTLKAAPPRQLVQRGSSATYNVSIARAGHFRGHVRLRALVLPHGATAQWTKTSMRVATGIDQRLESTRVVLEGSSRSGGRTNRRYAVVVLKVVGMGEVPSSGGAIPVVAAPVGGGSAAPVAAAPVGGGAAPVGVGPAPGDGGPVPAGGADFVISGDLATPLYPGAVIPLDVVLTNPQTFDIRVSALTVGVAAGTTKPGCNADANYAVAQYSGDYPLVLPPGSTRLSALVADSRDWPQISMHDLQSNQDACQGAILSLAYGGTAI